MIIERPREAPAAGLEKASVWPMGILVGLSLLAVGCSCALVISASAEKTRLLDGYLLIDPTARLFLLLINSIFFGVAFYMWYLIRTIPQIAKRIKRSAALSCAFMVAANLAILSNHFLASWLFLELTTLAAAPLVIREGTRSSLLASWRYFLFSSVGLALALLGFACIARSLESSGSPVTLFIDQLATSAPSNLWQKVGLALVLLGYGTKLGLAPMCTWLPEAYDEAPPSVTAMLAAVQFNCVLVGLFRVIQVFRAGNQELVAAQLLACGLLSMAVSAIGIITTKNYKRLLAYASINHAGVIAVGLGIGKTAMYGLLLYVVSNAYIKAILFLTAGRIKAHYHTKDMREVSWLIKDLPYSGLLLMVGTFALLGLPPFGSFIGELLILSELIRGSYLVVFVAFCVLLAITFVATGRSIFPMIWGEAKTKAWWPRQSLRSVLPKLVFLGALVSMGLYLPATLNALFRQVAASLGGQ
ncbi:MAG: hypothetical protein HKL90_04375 [Elusimicrobia bacterium]|nr:hypothetical protein [Elusimicrobiota bacterium]